MTNEQEIWQVDVHGQIYETSFEGLAQWINEGLLLPNDKVRRGNLRWLEAGKISLLYGFFNAKHLGVAPPIVFSTNAQSTEKSLPNRTENFAVSNNVTPNLIADAVVDSSKQNLPPKPPLVQNLEVCAIHAEVPPVYVCDSCANVFCKACPNTYSSVKICPFCGEMCQLLEVVANKEKRVRADSEKFVFMDFANALAYPFKFPASLIFGAIMFMVFTLGQSASSVGGLYLLSASIFCAMLANTLTFGILANTVENMANGKTDLDFMPRFDDFSMWDDVVHPFFLSIGVYLVSFGFFLILIVGAAWFARDPIKGAMEQATYQQLGTAFLQTAGLFLIPLFFALLWGLFYFPAACAVAGYTRSLTAVINPLIGLDTIKYLGFDYVKILLMALILTIFTFVVSLILGIIFSPFDLPHLGNLPAVAVASLFHFYFWIVFSTILGFSLYKNSARLKLFQTKNQ